MVTVLVAFSLTRIQLTRRMHHRLRTLTVPLLQAAADAQRSRVHLFKWYDTCHKEQLETGKTTHRQKLTKLENAFREKCWPCLTQRQETELPRLDEPYERARRVREMQYAEDTKRLQQGYETRLGALRSRAAQEQERSQKDAAARLDDLDRLYQEEVAACQRRWQTERDRLLQELHAMQSDDRRLFPPWDDPAWANWAPPSVPPPALRFGTLQIRLDRYAGGNVADPTGLLTSLRNLTAPALCACPEQGSLLLLARDAGRAAAMEILQTLMLRLLTAAQAGKVRFIILDPIGLGRNFRVVHAPGRL